MEEDPGSVLAACPRFARPRCCGFTRIFLHRPSHAKAVNGPGGGSGSLRLRGGTGGRVGQLAAELAARCPTPWWGYPPQIRLRRRWASAIGRGWGGTDAGSAGAGGSRSGRLRRPIRERAGGVGAGARGSSGGAVRSASVVGVGRARSCARTDLRRVSRSVGRVRGGRGRHACDSGGALNLAATSEPEPPQGPFTALACEGRWRSIRVNPQRRGRPKGAHAARTEPGSTSTDSCE